MGVACGWLVDGLSVALGWLGVAWPAEAAKEAELALLQRRPGTTLELLWGRSHVGHATI